jgi:basic membrane protein A
MLSNGKTARVLLAGALLLVLVIGTIQFAEFARAQQKVKIGVILPGRINDLAWNQAGYESMLRFQAKFSNEVEILWVENVDEKAAIQETARDYIARGAQLIIGHGFEYQQPLEELAVRPEYANVAFLVVAGFKLLPNLSNADVRTDQTGYILGYLAGKMTKNNKIGYIMGLRVAELARFEPNFAKGAHDANPRIGYDYGNVSSIIPGQKGIKPGGSISVVEIGDFHAVDKAKQAATAMASQGVDVIATMGDGVVLGTIQGAIDAKVFLIGNGIDIATAPVSGAENLVLGSGSWRWDSIFDQWYTDWKNKQPSKLYWAEMQNGGLKIDGPTQVVPDSVRGEVTDLVSKMVAGQIQTDQCFPTGCGDASAPSMEPPAAGPDVTTIGAVVVIVVIIAMAAFALRRRKPMPK